MPMAPTNGGRIIGTSTSAEKSALPGKSYLCEIQASGRAMAMASSVVPAAMAKLFARPSA